MHSILAPHIISNRGNSAAAVAGRYARHVRKLNVWKVREGALTQRTLARLVRAHEREALAFLRQI